RRANSASRTAYGPRGSDHLGRQRHCRGKDEGHGGRRDSGGEVSGNHWRDRPGGDWGQGLGSVFLFRATGRYRPGNITRIMKTLERTLTIIKPDAVKKKGVGDIIEQFEKQGFHILSMKMLEISKHQAEQFYAVHAGKPFFNSLTDFMSSGPIVVLALEKENAITDLRKLMGATNPANAEEGTIRKKWATNIEHNAIHGSDADETARFELSFFFAGYELAR